MNIYKDRIDLNNYLISALTAIGIIFLSQFINILINILFITLTDFNNEVTVLFALFVSMIIPSFLFKKHLLDKKMLQYVPFFISILISGILIVNKKITITSVIFTYTVSISEEMFFRGLIENHLEKNMPIWLAILIQSLLFGLINHSAYSILDNFLYRFPAGIILTLIYKKFGLGSSITLHYFHNLL
ncbi:MAG: CPBP family intramembrane metalloprotease [Lactobacillaceae bacterium]|jgi:membrane protease YdiL (CAAX protease family)|nr:CPBP family intramembrane metalloprotease [Lactobacillaceae bacterium]